MGIAAEQESAGSRGETWTTRRLIRWIDGHLASRGVDAPRVCAEMLVGHVLVCERMQLYMEADRPASPTELEHLRALVGRAARHEPVQYLVGEAWFWARRFAVGPATLIPRPATEHLVEEAIAACGALAAPGGGPVRLLEVGTGTGCVSVCVAAALSGQRRGTAPEENRQPPVDVRVVATDVEDGALVLARANAEAHRVLGAIDLRLGSLWDPLRPEERCSFHVLASNPPYVRDDEWGELAPNVRDFEPRSALAGGPRGMDVLGPLIAGAHEWLVPGGRLLAEIGHRQRDDVLDAARANPCLRDADVVRDFEGYWRLLRAVRD